RRRAGREDPGPHPGTDPRCLAPASRPEQDDLREGGRFRQRQGCRAGHGAGNAAGVVVTARARAGANDSSRPRAWSALLDLWAAELLPVSPLRMKAETSPKLPDIARQATAFRPAWWLQNRHAQTIASRLLRPRLDIPLRRERIDTPDGDFVDLDFADAGLPKDAPLV